MGFSWVSRIPGLGTVAKFCVGGQRPSEGPKIGEWTARALAFFVRFGKELSLRKVWSTQSDGWPKRSHCHCLRRLRQGVPDQSTLFQLYRYWRTLLGISVRFRNIPSEHGMEITIITETHCFHKSRMGTALTLSYRTWFQELCLNIELNSTYRCWKSYWTRFREWGCNETQLVPFCTKVSLIIPSW